MVTAEEVENELVEIETAAAQLPKPGQIAGLSHIGIACKFIRHQARFDRLMLEALKASKNAS